MIEVWVFPDTATLLLTLLPGPVRRGPAKLGRHGIINHSKGSQPSEFEQELELCTAMGLPPERAGVADFPAKRAMQMDRSRIAMQMD